MKQVGDRVFVVVESYTAFLASTLYRAAVAFDYPAEQEPPVP